MDSASVAAAPAVEHRVAFHGSGGEYFGIWIVNLVLTILTLGIYSAWAKVRRLKYFYGQTELAGARFDYHGNPRAILVGRLIGLLLFAAYTVATELVSWWTPVVLVLLAVVLPWLLRNAIRFQLHNSSYRGIRFAFDGRRAPAYVVFLLHPLLMLVTFYLTAPLFHQRVKRYQLGNARFGATAVQFHAGVGQFYRAYVPVMLLILGLFVIVIGTIGAAVSGVEPGAEPDPRVIGGAALTSVLVIFGGLLVIGPIWLVRTQNLIWNHTSLGEHRFVSTLRVWPLLWIQLSNLVGIMLTFGLFMPWAAVRMARYRAQNVRLIAASEIDAFVAGTGAEVTAAGEETAEIFDFDIGL